MKQVITLSASLFAFSTLFAQGGNLSVFSENGEVFTLIINGQKENASPQSRVQVTGLTAPYYKARIDFQDKSLPDMDANLMNTPGMETVYVIKKNRKGALVCKGYSQNPMAGTSSSSSSDMAQQTPPPPPPAPDENNNSGMGDGSGVSSTQTVTSTDNQNVNVGMNVNGASMNMNVSVPGAQTTTTTTTTTTTYSTSSSSNMDNDADVNETSSATPEETTPPTTGGCIAMDDGAFQQALKSISSKTFEETKLSQAKQVAKANCLSVQQVIAIAKSFTYEDSKLDFAKFAYDHTSDKGNYYLVNDVFTYSSSIDELNKYVNSH